MHSSVWQLESTSGFADCNAVLYCQDSSAAAELTRVVGFAQAWVMRSKQSHALVVSFRGTDARQVKTLTNLAFVPVPPARDSTIAQVNCIVRAFCWFVVHSQCYCMLLHCIQIFAP